MSSSPVTLFYSYAHEDEVFREELEKQLTIFQHIGLLSSWNDREIVAGQEWGEEIRRELESADVILFLVSADFIASNYCWDVEVKRGMERHAAGSARVIPVILRPVKWEKAPFAKLQALPKDGKPVSQWTSWDEALYNVAEGLEKALEHIQRIKLGGGGGAGGALPGDALQRPGIGLGHFRQGTDAFSGLVRGAGGRRGVGRRGRWGVSGGEPGEQAAEPGLRLALLGRGVRFRRRGGGGL
ncbi:MAG: toll/interleukin-1 receptor domain-containing protein, partial [Magnetococcales bacterium]|nr:toll/interleukin-1 receptor domain-containing protein [Magnetococcales bacterium]